MNVNSIDEDDGIRWLCPKCLGNDPILVLKKKPEKDNTCPKLMHGTCPHGVTGKALHRGKPCEFEHPKLCKKYIRYGNRGRFGCKEGDQCDLFHPILCQKSVKQRKCFNSKCTHKHLKGTLRRERKSHNPPNNKSGTRPPAGITAGSQQNAWFQRRQNVIPQNETWNGSSQPFLGNQQPAPQLVSLQSQVNRLEELIKKALNIAPPSGNVNFPPNPQVPQWNNQQQFPAALHPGC